MSKAQSPPNRIERAIKAGAITRADVPEILVELAWLRGLVAFHAACTGHIVAVQSAFFELAVWPYGAHPMSNNRVMGMAFFCAGMGILIGSAGLYIVEAHPKLALACDTATLTWLLIALWFWSRVRPPK